MVSIKDFEVGQTVYTLSKDHSKTTISECKVSKVGRKYVNIDNQDYIRYGIVAYFSFGLVEDIDWGNKTLLFASQNDLNNYLEYQDLNKFWNDIGYQRNKLTLEQLKIMKYVLDESCQMVYYVLDNHSENALVMSKSINDLRLYEIIDIDKGGYYWSTKELAKEHINYK